MKYLQIRTHYQPVKALITLRRQTPKVGPDPTVCGV